MILGKKRLSSRSTAHRTRSPRHGDVEPIEAGELLVKATWSMYWS
jgi:hypothetical protein